MVIDNWPAGTLATSRRVFLPFLSSYHSSIQRCFGRLCVELHKRTLPNCEELLQAAAVAFARQR